MQVDSPSGPHLCSLPGIIWPALRFNTCAHGFRIIGEFNSVCLRTKVNGPCTISARVVADEEVSASSIKFAENLGGARRLRNLVRSGWRNWRDFIEHTSVQSNAASEMF